MFSSSFKTFFKIEAHPILIHIMDMLCLAEAPKTNQEKTKLKCARGQSLTESTNELPPIICKTGTNVTKVGLLVWPKKMDRKTIKENKTGKLGDR